MVEALTAKIMFSPDELRGLFERAKTTANSRSTLSDELLKLYTTNVTESRARGTKTKIRIENAHLALVGGATETGYAMMWLGLGGMQEGLQSRVIPIGIENRKMPAIQRPANAEKLFG
jgi:hypothetical protein